MKLDSFQLLLVRLAFLGIIFIAWLFLPLVVTIALVLIGAGLFELYLEGVIFTAWMELAYNSPEYYVGGFNIALLSTILVLLVVMARDFIKDRLIVYN